MENEEEKKYTDKDLQASFWTGSRLWIEQNAVYLFLFFGAGIVVGFLLGFISVAQKACGA